MTKLRKFQKRGVEKIIKFKGRALLADEMGLGKTVQALCYLKNSAKNRPALVVCPSSAKWVWKSEIKKHTKFRCRILKTRKAHKFKPRDITIINYEILNYWKNEIRDTNFKTIILDECHYIKSWKAKRTKVVISLGRNIPHIIAMSGTPLTNKPKDLFTVLKLLLPDTFPSFVPFAFRYCNRRMLPWGWDDNGASHLDELHKILKGKCLIRRTKRQVLKELPEKQRIVIPLSIDMKRYKPAEDDFLNWIAENKPEHLCSALKNTALLKVGYLTRLTAILKVKNIITWIEDFLAETDEKLVIFAHHTEILQRIYKHFEKKIYFNGSKKITSQQAGNRLNDKPTNYAVMIRGATGTNARHHIIQRFQKSEETRLFIGQIQAAGTAITLTAASTVAFAELNWSPANHVQAEDRVHRIGQKNYVKAYYLVAKDTIETDLCKIIQKKARLISKVLEGKRHKEEMNVYDVLLTKIRNKI